jgi:hypothetical protein
MQKVKVYRYENRKFYVRGEGRYLQLMDIDFEKHVVIDHKTKTDVTELFKIKAEYMRKVQALGYNPRKV